MQPYFIEHNEQNNNNQDQQQQSGQSQEQNQGDTVNEVRILEGVYFTDYRKQYQKDQQQMVNNLNQQPCFQQMVRGYGNQKKGYNPESINNALLLEMDFKNFENEINHLRDSIEVIQEEENWEDDKDFVEAIEENYSVIDKMIQNMTDIIVQMQVIDAGNKLVEKQKAILDEKNKNLQQEQQFYIHMENYRNNKAQEYQQATDNNQNNQNNNNNEKEKEEGIYL